MKPEGEIRDAARSLLERKFIPQAEQPDAAERIDADLDGKIGKLAKRGGRYREQLVALLSQSRELWSRRSELDRKQVTLLGAALLYFISPLDLVPDVIPGLGYVDDFFVLAYVVQTLRSGLRVARDKVIAHATDTMTQKGRKALEEVIDSRLLELDRASAAAVQRSLAIVAISLWGTTTAAAVSLAIVALTGRFGTEWTIYVTATTVLVGFWNIVTALSYWREFRALPGSSQQRLALLFAARTRMRDVVAIVAPVLLLLGLMVVRYTVLA